MHVIHTTTVSWIVAVSVFASILASYAAFSFAERIATSQGWSSRMWLGCGAAAMGLGIWSMHYLGMLAVRLPIEVAYHVPTVLLSLLLAVLASAVALFVVSRDALGIANTIGGSLLMGVGIGGMHYVGMHAMRCSAMHQYDLRIVLLSVIVAVVFSWMALRIAFSVRKRAKERDWLRIGGATLMGIGIAAMHYTAMAAVTFQSDDMAYSIENTVKVSTIGTAAIAAPIAILLCGAILTAMIDRRGYQKLRLALEQLSEERDRFQAVAEASMDALTICTAVRDAQGEIQDFVLNYVNDNVAQMVEVPLDQLQGQKMCEKLPLNRTLGLFDRYKRVVLTGEPLAYEFAIDHPLIEAEWIRVQAVKVRDGLVITASDITTRKRQEEEVFHKAHHDHLTGLLNRTLMHDRILQAIEGARRYQTRVAFVLVDLDEFKEINDSLGHSAGDKVLVTIATRLKAAVRTYDSVFRLGGDEFLVVMSGLRLASDAHRCAEKLVQSLRLPIAAGMQRISVTCSLGCAVYPDSGHDEDTLLAKADEALYAAKGLGKDRFHVYTVETEAEPEPQSMRLQ